MKTICVFCGASQNVESKYIALAERCGEIIGQHQHTLLYGGSTGGLMGTVARAAQVHGSKVVGVFPLNVLNQKEILSPLLDESILVESMYQRKEIMIERSDIFVTLPGGFGTLDEFFEVLTLRNLEQHKKKLIVVNFEGFWDPILEMIDKIFATKFANAQYSNGYTVINNIEAMGELL